MVIIQRIIYINPISVLEFNLETFENSDTLNGVIVVINSAMRNSIFYFDKKEKKNENDPLNQAILLGIANA